jgi:hypothetical protein
VGNLAISALIGLTALASTPETQQIQIQCGGLAGHSFYAEENLIPAGEGGWIADANSQGESVSRSIPTPLLSNTNSRMRPVIGNPSRTKAAN